MRSSKTMAAGVVLFTLVLLGGLAWANAASYIDEHNRFILNGEPFFPLGLYVVQCTNGSYSAQLDEIADSPFDTVMNYAVNRCGSVASAAQILGYLDQLASRDLKLIFSLSEYFDGGQADIDTITHKVNTFKTHPAVISWYMNDERDPATYLTQLEERYQKIKELDENHPVWSVHWNTNWLIQEAHTTDIVGVDPYPIGNHPITLVTQMADAANGAGKPLWLVPQIFSWTDYPGDPRAATGYPPTREEMRAMSYLAVNHGAKGLVYYSYFNIRDDADYDVRWPEIKEIANEIDELRPVFLSIDPTKPNDALCDHADVDFKVMRRDNTYYLFAVNTKKETIKGVSFQLDMVVQSTSVDVLFEHGRQTSLQDGHFADDFDLYEVHVYCWQASPDQDGDGVADEEDNCPDTYNPRQEDRDSDGTGDACESEGTTICSTLGNDPRQYAPDMDVFKFSGTEGELVTVALESSPPESGEGERAVLIMRSLGRGLRLFERLNDELPLEMMVTLPMTGDYHVKVMDAPGRDVIWGKKYQGDYCVTLEASPETMGTFVPDLDIE